MRPFFLVSLCSFVCCYQFINVPTFVGLLFQPADITQVASKCNHFLPSLTAGRVLLAYALLLFVCLFHFSVDF